MKDSYTDGQPLTIARMLTNCDLEAIHQPGAIQPHGFLLCLDEQTHRIVQASANTGAMIGMEAQDLLEKGLDQLLGPNRLAEVEALLATLTETPKLLGARLEQVPGQPFYKMIMHRYDQLLWLEFEPVTESDTPPLDLPFLNAALSDMLAAGKVLEFCQHAVDQVRAISGFDRVAIYRFEADESGEIIAENIRPDLPPWLGLHYPASDVPVQARAMYLKTWLRFIPTATYKPVPMVPVNNPATNRPPDMTHAVLRSVSPLHLEYMRNMGTSATMTISIIQNGRLWGMMTCHHHSPRLISFELRELCQFIGKTFSALLASKEQHDDDEAQLRIHEQQTRLMENIASHDNFVEGLRQTPSLMDLFDCGGAAVCFDGEVVTMGATPTPAQIREIAAWLAENARADIFSTSSYASLNPAGLDLQATASGIIAASLTDTPGNYLLWFRPEVVQVVTWAGMQEKARTLVDGRVFLSPRQSFEAWKQLVKDTAVPWKPMEIQAAREIRLHIYDIRLKVFNELQARALSLSRLNSELERSNDELDSFAYVASHDLKEPLRGIHNYSLFLLEDYADRLDADGVHKLNTLVRLSQRMEGLIESLFQLSRVGRTELAMEAVDMDELLVEVTDLLQPRLEQTNTTLTVIGPLPPVRGDLIRIQEIFHNLLTNAMKYNDKSVKTITVGLLADGSGGNTPVSTENINDFYILYVKDNGIGIDPKHHGNIFKLFKRLHTQEKYGGGTGAGLAIAKKMVERHGGNLWLESTPGLGATFYFTLPKYH